jgi:hypothetical protein
MEIPICEDNEGAVQKEHCWHPSGPGAQAPQSQRCCHCGLGFCIQRSGQAGVGRKHGKHGRNHRCQSYQIVFDTTYQDMYKADPESFERIFAAMEESRLTREEFYKNNPRMRGF